MLNFQTIASKLFLWIKALGPLWNIFTRMQCNILAPDHAVVELHANILCSNLFHFCFCFSEIVVPCLKCWLSKRWLYSSWMKMRTKKPLQRKLEKCDQLYFNERSLYLVSVIWISILPQYGILLVKTLFFLVSHFSLRHVIFEIKLCTFLKSNILSRIEGFKHVIW